MVIPDDELPPILVGRAPLRVFGWRFLVALANPIATRAYQCYTTRYVEKSTPVPYLI